MDWFRQLQCLYSSVQEGKDQKVEKRRLGEALNRAQLQLRTPEKYYSEETERAFSYAEVRKALSDLRTSQVSWDQIIDAIYTIGSAEKTELPTSSPSKDAVTTLSQYQSIASSPLKTQLGASIVILNLSHSQLREFELNCLLPTLQLLNLSHNSLQKLSMLQRCKGLKEAYLSANRLTAVSSLCHLERLKVLDLAENLLSVFENIACLAVNSRLKALKLTGNPVFQRAEYRQTVHMLLPSIQHLDPASIYAFSQFRQRRLEAFGDIDGEIGEKAPICSENVETRRQMCPTPKPIRPHSRNTSPKQARPQTPLQKPNPQSVPTPCHSLHTVHQSLDEAFSVLAEAEKRLQLGETDPEAVRSKHQHSVSLITTEAIEKAHRPRYGNPVAALMIGPPAGSHKRPRSKSRTENRSSPLPCRQPRKPLTDHNSRFQVSQCARKKGY